MIPSDPTRPVIDPRRLEILNWLRQPRAQRMQPLLDSLIGHIQPPDRFAGLQGLSQGATPRCLSGSR